MSQTEKETNQFHPGKHWEPHPGDSDLWVLSFQKFKELVKKGLNSRSLGVLDRSDGRMVLQEEINGERYFVLHPKPSRKKVLFGVES